MQLLVDIKDESIADKIVWFLKSFQDKGVAIIDNKSPLSEEETKFSDEYIAKNWKEMGMNTDSADLDDDERMYEAAAEFYDAKHTS